MHAPCMRACKSHVREAGNQPLMHACARAEPLPLPGPGPLPGAVFQALPEPAPLLPLPLLPEPFASDSSAMAPEAAPGGLPGPGAVLQVCAGRAALMCLCCDT